MTASARPSRLAEVTSDWPAVVPARVRTALTSLAASLDAIGRIDPRTATPYIDAHTLRSTLANLSDKKTAADIISTLESIPGSAFRAESKLDLDELSWFDLADHVEVYDSSRDVTFRELLLEDTATAASVAIAVRKRFPSLELELLDPQSLPPAIAAMSNRVRAEWLQTVSHHLGWWAAVIGAVMAGLAAYSQKLGKRSLAWPLSMFVVAAAVGGWTLTIVRNTGLAPPD